MARYDHDTELPDLSSWNKKYTDLRAECELLKRDLSESQKALAVAEGRADRLEAELERTKAQLMDAVAKAASSRTLIESIAATIVNHIGGPGKSLSDAARGLMPSGNGGRKFDDIVRQIGDRRFEVVPPPPPLPSPAEEDESKE